MSFLWLPQEIYQTSSFKKNFLSDPSTYPLMVVMSVAGCIIVGMSTNAFLNYKDLRMTPEHKHKVIQDWGQNKRTTVTSVVSQNPVAFHAQSFKDIRQEGLGVDHEQWKKSKEAYNNLK